MPDVASTRPSGLHLNPPIPGSKKRAPSLFDKIAGMFTEADDGDLAGGASSDTTSGSQGSGGGLFSGFSVPRRAGASVQPAQPQMVQTPQPPAPEMYVHRQQPMVAPVQTQAQPAQQSGPDLEIPAFLRRQIS
jgi:hypothetical protein